MFCDLYGNKFTISIRSVFSELSERIHTAHEKRQWHIIQAVSAELSYTLIIRSTGNLIKSITGNRRWVSWVYTSSFYKHTDSVSATVIWKALVSRLPYYGCWTRVCMSVKTASVDAAYFSNRNMEGDWVSLLPYYVFWCSVATLLLRNTEFREKHESCLRGSASSRLVDLDSLSRQWLVSKLFV
jgi:hypothetical protein